MSAVQFVPLQEVRPGDRVRERGKADPIESLPEVVRLDGGSGVFVQDGASERFVAFRDIEAAVRIVRVTRP
jgi:hypothetical protein